MSRDFYCSQKFRDVSINVQNRTMSACCYAQTEKIDLEFLRQNPGRLFNMPFLLQERQDMLNNRPVKSCEAACWIPESQGVTSRRDLSETGEKSHTDIETEPEVVSVILSTDCNLTCSYCSPTSSTAWARDIMNNGAYSMPHFDDASRYQLSERDKILFNISQKEMTRHPTTNLILSGITKIKPETHVKIIGGEPLLHNDLPDLINMLGNQKITVITGLGVDSTRLQKILNKIDLSKNIIFTVSAETTGSYYELNRYGITYEKFLNNLDIVRATGKPVSFSCVLSNLTVFDHARFAEEFAEHKQYTFCSQPDFMTVNVMDDESKQYVIDQLESSDIEIKNTIIDSVRAPCTQEQRQNLKAFVTEFVRRRPGLSLDVFPKSFVNWIQ